MQTDKQKSRPVDLVDLIANIKGKTEVARTLIQHLLNTFPLQLDLLEECIREEKHEEAAQIAHTIKGALMNFKAEEAVKLAAAIEISARQKKTRDAVDIAESFRRETERVIAYFKNPDWLDDWT